jgi:putative membrane protein
MFVEILIALVLGVHSGIITGLIPGVHINLISLLLVSISGILLVIFSPLALGVFIIAMAITHTFLDSIPGIYLGAPDADQALNVLPGHKLLIKGLGHCAVLYTVIGSLFSVIIVIILFPILLYLMKIIYPVLKKYIGWILIGIMCYMILKEKGKKKLYSFFMFSLAGVLGIIVLTNETLNQPLFPLLSGLFGFSILILSLLQKSSIPKQSKNVELKLKKKNLFKAIGAASSVGFVAGFLPGFGSSQAAILGTQVVGNIGDEGFLTLVGGINSANMMISIGTAYALNKARNGGIIAVNKIIGSIGFNEMIVFVIVGLIAAGVATILAINLSKVFCSFVSRISYWKIVSSILTFITVLTFVFDGWYGLLILIVSTAIGISASELGVGKNHLMGCLILPVILFFVL